MIEPSLSLKGIWDFDKGEIVDLDTGLATSTDDLRLRARIGLSAQFANGWSITGEGFYDGFGADDLEAAGGSIKFVIPFD